MPRPARDRRHQLRRLHLAHRASPAASARRGGRQREPGRAARQRALAPGGAAAQPADGPHPRAGLPSLPFPRLRARGDPARGEPQRTEAHGPRGHRADADRHVRDRALRRRFRRHGSGLPRLPALGEPGALRAGGRLLQRALLQRGAARPAPRSPGHGPADRARDRARLRCQRVVHRRGRRRGLLRLGGDVHLLRAAGALPGNACAAPGGTRRRHHAFAGAGRRHARAGGRRTPRTGARRQVASRRPGPDPARRGDPGRRRRARRRE